MRTTTFTSGLITGAIIGATIGVIMDPMKDKHSSTIRSQATGFFKTIGGVLDNVVNGDR